jgi:C4-dicarboxylate-specific signal transduction histidine kinase
VRYGLAVGSVLLAHLAVPALHHELFILAILVSAWFGGAGPGLLAVGLSLAGKYHLTTLTLPRDAVSDANDVLYLALWSASALFVVWLARTQRRTEKTLREAQENLQARMADLERTNERLQAEMLERMNATEALQLAQSELAHVTRVLTVSEIASSIAHEVNQPLAAIVMSGNACRRWLAADPPNLDEAREALQRIVSDGSRASEITKRIRTLLRKGAPEKIALNINELIDDTLSLTRSELTQRQISIRTMLDENLPPVVGDRVQLQQVLVNLILNSADAMSAVTDGPRLLTLRTGADDGDGIQVDVEDTGVGLAVDHPDSIFQPFFSTKPNGLGMGLSISHSIVGAHGGRLWATPNTGRGATLHFTIPEGRE